MSKNPNNRSKPSKRNDPMPGATLIFLVGCIAELYLLMIRRFYINGTLEQVLAWDSYLPILAGAGAVVLVIGVILSFLWKQDKKKRMVAWGIAAAGAFLALSTGLVLWNLSVLTLLIVLVPVVMLLGLVWLLYDRECALTLTVLGISLILLWVCRRQLNSASLGSLVKIAAVVYILLLVALAVLVKQKKLPRLLPVSADSTPVYVGCGISVAALAAALFSTTIAYYAMWAMAAVVFGLAVYYTVKQL